MLCVMRSGLSASSFKQGFREVTFNRVLKELYEFSSCKGGVQEDTGKDAIGGGKQLHVAEG